MKASRVAGFDFPLCRLQGYRFCLGMFVFFFGRVHIQKSISPNFQGIRVRGLQSLNFSWVLIFLISSSSPLAVVFEVPNNYWHLGAPGFLSLR